METLNFVKNFRNGGDWEQTGMSEEEETSLQEIIQKKNDGIMRKCFEMAEKIIAKYTAPYSGNLESLTQVACSIYNSNRIHAQHMFESYMARKIYLLRNGNGNHARIEDFE